MLKNLKDSITKEHETSSRQDKFQLRDYDLIMNSND